MTQRQRQPRATLVRFLVLAMLVLSTMVVMSACNGDLGLIGSVRGSGDLETREYRFDDFSALDIGSAFVATVAPADATKSAPYSITITADDNLLDLIEVKKSDQTVKIDLDRTTRVSNATLRATITMPSLDALSVSGATQAAISGFSSKDTLALEASGASFINGDVTAGVVDIDVSGASKIELTGTATEVAADVSGASNLVLADFLVTHARMDVSGASMATVNLTGRLDADVSGASKLRYLGEPTMGDISTSGASTIERQ